MEHFSLSEINGIWKMLNEMATADPISHQKFLFEQMKNVPGLLSQPQCRGFLKCTLKGGCSILINICEWQLIDKPKSETAPIPLYCGNIYNVDNSTIVIKKLYVLLLVKVTCVAMHPSVFVQYNLLQASGNANSDINQLLALIILFIKQEKNVHTIEWDEINTHNLMNFHPIWCRQPYGGESEMLKSLHYKKFSLTDVTKQLLKSNDASTDDKPKSNESSKLIQEVRPNPCWQQSKNNKKPNTYEYKIVLPRGSGMEDCELDISKTALSLQLRSNPDYPEAFYTQFEKPINIQLARARYNKSKHCLYVTAPFL